MSAKKHHSHHALPPKGEAVIALPECSSRLLKRLVRDYVRHHLRKIALAVVCMTAAAAATAANAWLLQPVLDEIFLKRSREMLSIIPTAVLAVALVNGAASYGQVLIMRQVGQRIIADMQIALFSHLMRADLGLFHDQASGRLISRFTNDIQMMRAAVSNVLTGLARESLTLVFLLAVMLHQSRELSLIALVVFPTAVWPVLRLGRRMRKLSHNTQRELGQFTAQLDEIFSGARIVKAYTQEEREISRARAVIEALYALYVKASRVQAAAAPIMEMLAGVAVAAVIWYGGMQVMEGTTTPGAFFSFIAAMIMAYRPMKSLAGINTQLQEGLAAAQRFFEAMDTMPEIADRADAVALAISEGHVRFERVAFRYDGRGGGVEDITLDIPAGKTVALVGASGSGKTTLMHLLLRFYDPQGGRITVDGQDIRGVTQHSLRSQMALVAQDTFLFDDTVAGNIAYGVESASREAVAEAARQADADAFIRAMPEGYDTRIGPHGVKLSGGQRQRLAIARAILKNAPLLLLDEATSSLDTASERSVQDALARMMRQRTTLVIAHRLSTIRHADKIYVLDHGRVAEEGTHEELIARGGAYTALHAHQFAGAEEE